MRKLFFFFLTLVGLFSCTHLKATHIVGAQLYYECLNTSNNTYKVTLKLYRDCLNGQAPYDDSIFLYIFTGTSGTLYQTIVIPIPPITPQLPPVPPACVASPVNLCTEEGIYTRNVQLPPLAGGYNLAWARCCRNYAITNLANPAAEGVTFLAHVPDPGLATCNTMPIFKNTPPIFLCAGQPFSFDYSATDADGDLLVYQLSNPYTGTNFAGAGAGNPQLGGNQPVVNPGNPMGPPPYATVVFAPGHSFTNPFGPGSTIAIDPSTGLLEVTPNAIGIYVLAVSVYEYRNGQLLSENKQDIQIHVIACLPQDAPPDIVHDLNGIPHSNDTVIIVATNPFCFPVTITDSILNGILQVTEIGPYWNGANGANWTSTGVNPVLGQVCWTPPCNLVGQTIPLVLKVNDTGNCPGYGTAFDTIWVKIILPPNTAPVIVPDYTGLTIVNGTIVINATNQLCYPFVINDLEGDSISLQLTGAVFSGPNPPVVTPTGINPFQGTICWTPACNLAGTIVPITFTATDYSECGVTHTVSYAVNILVQIPPNNTPTLTLNLNNTTHVGDTIFVNALSGFCYDFQGTDADANDILTALGVGAPFTGANPPTITLNGTNPVNGQVCWTPGCQYVGQTIPLIIKIKDTGVCNNIGEDYDTVWVHISIPPNTPPIINANLAGLNANGDTIFVYAEDQMCFPFVANDIDPSNALTFQTVSPIFNTGTNPPSVNFSGTNPITGQICWTPDCSYDGQVIPFIFGVADNGACNNSLNDFDTVYVSISIPPNTAPVIVHNLNGTIFSNDTIQIYALSNFCYTFTVNDINGADSLLAYPLSPIFTGVGAPSFSVTGVNPLQGQICWTPDCQYIGQVIPFIIEATDNARCNTDLQVQDTVYIQINMPPNDPPTAVHDLLGNVFINDTIFVDATDTICYNIVAADININDTLLSLGLSPIFTATNAPSITVVGTNPLNIQICWVPDCSYEGMLIPFVVQAFDNGKCNNILSAFDTVYVKISDPVTAPPIVWHDLAGTNHVGNLIQSALNDTLCFDFFIADVTPGNGVNYYIETQDFVSGQPQGLGWANSVYQNDTIFGTYCFVPTCGNGGSTYRVVITGRDKETCPPFQETKDTVYIKVNTQFFILASNDTFFCQAGGGIQLNVVPLGGTPGYFYTWNCTNPQGCGISSPYVPNPTVNPPGLGGLTTYYVQLSDTLGCTSEIDSVNVRVYPLPIVDAGKDTTLCENDWGFHLNPHIVNNPQSQPPYQYSWFPSTGLSDPTLINPYCDPNVTTIYTLVVQDAKGCKSFTSTLDTLSTIVVNVNPSPQVEAGATQAICARDTVQLFGFASGAGTNYNYSWTPTNGLFDTDDPNSFGVPPLTTTYTLAAWSNGCYGSDTVTVFVHTIPTANPGVVYEICGMDSVLLTGYAAGDWDVNATYNFSWSPSLGLNYDSLAEPMASPLNTTTYSLIATSSHGCVSAPYQVTVYVLPTPIANAGYDTMLCGAIPVQLNGSFTSYNGAAINNPVPHWTPSANINAPFSLQPIAYPQQSTTYTLTVQNGACTTKDSVTIQVFPAAQIELQSDSNVICGGAPLQLNVAGASPMSIYSWTPATGLNNPNISNPIANPSVSTLYTISVRDGHCETKDSIFLKVQPEPVADYFASHLNGCIGTEIQFLENAINEIAYIWDFGDNSPIDNTRDPHHTYTQPGDYITTLTVIGNGGCKDTFAAASIHIAPKPLADYTSEPTYNQTIMLPEGTVQFINQTQNAVSYLWDFGDGKTAGDKSPTHSFHEAGEFSVLLIVTGATGCTDSALYTYNVLPPDLFIPNVFTPNNDNIHDIFFINYTGIESFSLQIYDRWGNYLFEGKNVEKGWDGNNMNGKAVSSGTYYYVLMIGEKKYTGWVELLR
jgi:gliding motility-associated-like protein